MLEKLLARGAKATRVLASGAVLLTAAAAVGGLIDREAQATETNEVALIAFTNPAPGRQVSSPFGFRKLPWEKKKRLHAGVDIAAPKGSPVVATTDGVIARVGKSASYGNFVEVAHGAGLTSKYAHLSGTMPGVAPGLPVSEGEKIAMVGSTGRSTGPHLHFELRKNGEPMDPAKFTDRTFRADLLSAVEDSALGRVGDWARYTILGKS